MLNTTIDMYAYCTIEEWNEDRVEFVAADSDEVFTDRLSPYYEYGGLLDLHKGVYNYVVKEFLNGEPLPLKVTTYSNAPAGSGLGSSSTMVVAILAAYAELLHLPMGEYDMAQAAFIIERKNVGLSGGRQDQYTATFGGVNFLEFYVQEHVIVNPLRIKDWIMNEFEASTMLYYTGVSRDSANIISDQIKNFEMKEKRALEAAHTVKADASRMKEALLLKHALEQLPGCVMNFHFVNEGAQAWRLSPKNS